MPPPSATRNPQSPIANPPASRSSLLASPPKSQAQITVDKESISAFCRTYHVRRLALFGSVLLPDFGAGSDIDVLVEFEPGRAPGLFTIARMERELSRLFENRKVDLRTPQDLSRYFRQEVVEQAEEQYAAR